MILFHCYPWLMDINYLHPKQICSPLVVWDVPLEMFSPIVGSPFLDHHCCGLLLALYRWLIDTVDCRWVLLLIIVARSCRWLLLSIVVILIVGYYGWSWLLVVFAVLVRYRCWLLLLITIVGCYCYDRCFFLSAISAGCYTHCCW